MMLSGNYAIKRNRFLIIINEIIEITNFTSLIDTFTWINIEHNIKIYPK